MRFALLCSAAFILAACGQPTAPKAGASPDAAAVDSASDPREAAIAPATATAPLHERLDCLRTSGGLLLIGHRGGPTRDYPENAIETLDVDSQHVVLGDAEAADGCSRLYPGVWAMPVVSVRPDGKVGGALV
jgi:hypothetical protein